MQAQEEEGLAPQGWPFLESEDEFGAAPSAQRAPAVLHKHKRALLIGMAAKCSERQNAAGMNNTRPTVQVCARRQQPLPGRWPMHPHCRWKTTRSAITCR